MTSSGDGTFHIYGSKGVISIPTRLWRDTSFPFSDKDILVIKINGEKSITIGKKIKGQKVLD